MTLAEHQPSRIQAPHLRQRLSREVWQARIEDHHARVDALLAGALERRRVREKHPVEDFLFEYYSFKPTKLRRWTPGFGVLLEDADPRTLAQVPGAAVIPGVGVALDPTAFPAHRLDGARFIARLMESVTERPPFLGCFGMHEWAMVYRIDEVRHGQVPLRMEPEALAAFVESRPIACSHYDAFRFFTPAARPLNRHQPAFETMAEMEQPGCLHTNMDLYRWSYKLYPWVSSELITDAFELALSARVLDMRASPYDLRDRGYEPIPIETPEGRRQYQAEQLALSERAAPLRARLLEASRWLLAHVAPRG